MIYLDNNATTPVHPDVVNTMIPYFSEKYGNPSSVHMPGREAKKAIERAREQVAALINADPTEIYFTSGGTEANNLALRGMIGQSTHLVTGSTEHISILRTAGHLESRQGFIVSVCPVDKYGVIDKEIVLKNIRKDITVVSIMHANNETGTINPIKDLASAVKSVNGKALFHCDAVQSLGKLKLNVKDSYIDMMSLSAHKVYGPKGIGALYIRNGVKLNPQVTGGHQENDLRAGTENVPNIVGFGKACELAMDYKMTKISQMRADLMKKLLEIPGATVNGHPTNVLPNTLNMSFRVSSDLIIMNVSTKGVSVSAGSACESDKPNDSHVLKAMGIESNGGIRMSLGGFNTPDEIKSAGDILSTTIKGIRNIL